MAIARLLLQKVFVVGQLQSGHALRSILLWQAALRHVTCLYQAGLGGLGLKSCLSICLFPFQRHGFTAPVLVPKSVISFGFALEGPPCQSSL